MKHSLNLNDIGKCFQECKNSCPYTINDSLSLYKDRKINNTDEDYFIHIHLQPEEKLIDIPRKKAKNVSMLLDNLGILPYTSIVVCGNMLLTPDSPLYSGQHILIRKVMSSG